jgi:hypothetical protein
VDISVLLPTRNRPELLAYSISTLLDLADEPDAVEFLLAVDPDTPAQLPRGVHGQVWTAPERYGAVRMHEYYNHLATMATGAWLMLWNDDATMMTARWDSWVRDNPGVCLWMDHCGTGPEHCNMFPVWPRAWTDVIGHIADGSPRVDTWIQEVAELLGRQVKIPVQYRHEVPGGYDNPDQTWLEGREYRLDEFHALQPLRIQEAARLREHGF